MDMQGASPIYTPAGSGPPPAGNPPVLGQQNPVTANTAPAQGGLSVLGNPLAQQLQSQGRGEDTMLVHMTPNEVNSLQGLAMAHGGSLTINPNTGLPEAGWLGKLLPTILGFAGAAFGLPTWAIGLAGAAGGTAATGSLSKGLMMGLQAFGGASLAGGLGVGKAGEMVAKEGLKTGAGELTKNVAQTAGKDLAKTAGQGVMQAAKQGVSNTLGAAPNVAANALTKTGGGFFNQFGAAAQQGLPGGVLSKAAPALATSGLLSGLSAAATPTGGYKTATGQVDNSYQGPYTAQRRTPTFAADTSEILGSSKERRYFDVDQPEIYNMQGQVVQPGSSTARGTPILQSYLLPEPKKKKDGAPMYGFRTVPYMEPLYAKGGEVELADGAFVVDARTVSELGNGSSNAGHEILAELGGRPVRGPGDGVSDSVPARIGRDQPARVARDEVIFSPEAVRQIGKGDEKRGAQKLYAIMDRAHKARQKASRGKDTGLRKGLA